eukprot:TRINITY_DN12589_c0_g1_i1.p1 TRINITY_DN12589_c0_g1~~TRINITY_DN12589_c0_g1_i1.p1  ORF type:complete len:364 (-),score=30.37 TRINITY_DN12589_c0_g1_i1:40-1131(-)
MPRVAARFRQNSLSHPGVPSKGGAGKRAFAKRIFQRLRNRASSIRNAKWRFVKPPQLLRWDLLGVLMSWLWGSVCARTLPVRLRIAIYNLWAYTFSVNLEEMQHSIESYETLADFFSRPLREGARTVHDDEHGMASPCDGKVITCGEITCDAVEQVKGVTYSMSGFLGTLWNEVKHNPDHKLYQCVIYLAPGDYHRIHSPTEWNVQSSRHFPGTLFPISPTVTRLIPNLFALNERVVLNGVWKHGFYSLSPVGAYNVGSISLNFDESIRTNVPLRDYTCPNLRYFSFGGMGTYAYEKAYDDVEVERGEELGKFNLGSTVVLIFECPEFEFSVKAGDRVLMGQFIGACKPAAEDEPDQRQPHPL